MPIEKKGLVKSESLSSIEVTNVDIVTGRRPGATGIVQFLFLLSFCTSLLDHLLPKIAQVRVLDILMLLTIVVHFLVQQGIIIPRGIVPISIAMFSIYPVILGLIAQFMLNEKSDLVLKGITPAIRTLLYSGFFWIGYDLLRRQQRLLRRITMISLFFLTLNVGYALIQFSSIMFRVPPRDVIYWPEVVRVDGTSWRSNTPTGLLGGPNILATLGLMYYSLGLGLSLSRMRLGNIFAFLGGLAIFLSMRRSTLLIAICLTFVTIWYGDIKQKLASTGLLGLVMIFIVFSIHSYEQLSSFNAEFAERIYSLNLLIRGETDDPSLSNFTGRVFGTWSDYLRLAMQYPLGMGLYPPNVLQVGSDNTYLTYAVWGGLPLLFLYLSILALAFISSSNLIRSARTELDKGVGFSLWFLTLAIALNGIAWGGVMSLPHYSIFWVAFSAALAIRARLRGSAGVFGW